MNFEENLKNFINRVDTIKGDIATEEATKTSVIMPFFQILGYDVFNPLEFIPEYTADVGIKKGEKVDYAVCINGDLTLIIEAKSINQNLEKHDSQLFRYFGTTTAKFAILTNGIVYRFFTDLEEQNKMDNTPFFEINLLEITENDISELKKFCKENFDLNLILDTASELKYLSLIKKVLKEEFTNPSDDFVRFILSQGIWDGVKTQSIVDKYKPTIKKSIAQYINELVNDKIQNALKEDSPTQEIIQAPLPNEPDSIPLEEVSNILTTEEELQSFYIIKSILRNKIELNRITYKDTASYFSILLDEKVSKWVCRIFIKEKIKYVIIPNNSINEKYTLSTLDCIYDLSDKLCQRLDELVNS